MTVEQIIKALREKGADFSDVYEESLGDLRLVTVSIHWGDWKHSHIYLDHVMKELGFLLLKENLTESDGSDCYSSDHIFYSEKDAEKVKAYQELFKEKED